MDRYWLLTNTLYGTRLPGDLRGFVGQVWEHRPDDPDTKRRVRHAIPGTPCDEDIAGLQEAAAKIMKGPPIHINKKHAEALLEQFQETAKFRGWEIRAVAIMFDHFHIVVGVMDDPEPGKILGDFKSWGTRKLSEKFGAPRSKTWWTERGSKRKLKDDLAIAGATHYVLYEQPDPLLTWSPETGLVYGIPLKGLASVEPASVDPASVEP